jgi:zinc carboxypeptidase
MNRLGPVGLVLVMLTVTAALGGPKQKPYQPMGAPADPKVAVHWNRYHDYSEATALLKKMAAAHPDRAELTSLGKSYGDREMWLLTITNSKTGEDRTKPAFWIDGAIHANEIQGTQVTLYTAWYLLEMYGRHDAVTRLVDERTFYMVPMMSPDSRDAHMYEPNTTSSPRSGQIPVDDDRDGLVDEDPHDDLDGDGHITQMRRRDPNGRWKIHPDYPNLMIQAKDDQRGEYVLLGSEGFDNDGDGRVNEDGDGYYDPNRDWARQWQPKYVQGGAYRYPFSVGENRLVAEFVLDHPNIAGAQSYHNTGGMILRGPGNGDDEYSARDRAVYDAIAAKGEQMLPFYDYLVCSTGLYNVYGGEFDWFFGMRGIFSFTNELFTRENYFRRELENRREGEQDFDKLLLLGQGTVAWHEVDHPQYGPIEVGGKRKEWGRQPPSFLLEEECHRNMAFTLYHADQMPQVAIQSVDVKPLAGKLVEVTATIINQKVIPTHADVDVKNKITPPDVASISGRKLKVIAGLRSSRPFFQDAEEQEYQPQKVRIPSIPGMGAVYVRWLVEGPGPYTINVQSAKGGSDQVRKE